MMYLYAIQNKDYAEFIKSFFDGAVYNQGELILCGLTEEQIATFDGEIVRIDAMDLTDEQLTALVTDMVEAVPTGKLVIASIPQGKFLHKNHPAFNT